MITREEFNKKVRAYQEVDGRLTLLGEMQFLSDEGIIKMRTLREQPKTISDFEYAIHEMRLKDYGDFHEILRAWRKDNEKNMLPKSRSFTPPRPGGVVED